MRQLAVAIVLLSLLPACLGPRTESSRYYTLPEAAQAPAAPAPPAGAPSLGLGPITLPPYLARPELATRLGPERIAYAADDRWAAPLEDLLVRALAEGLRTGLPAREIVRWPWALGSPPDVTVSVDLMRFEADAAGGVTLEARWTVTRRGGSALAGETRIREGAAPGDVAGSVAALGRALGALSRDIAAAGRGGAPR